MIHLPEIDMNFLKPQDKVGITFLYAVNALYAKLMYILFWIKFDRFLIQIIIYSSCKYYTTDNISEEFVQIIDKIINKKLKNINSSEDRIKRCYPSKKDNEYSHMKLVFLIFSFEKTCILDFILWSPVASLYVSIFICKFVALVGVFVIFALWKDYLLVIGNILHRVFRWVIFVGIVAIVNYIRFGDKLR